MELNDYFNFGQLEIQINSRHNIETIYKFLIFLVIVGSLVINMLKFLLILYFQIF